MKEQKKKGQKTNEERLERGKKRGQNIHCHLPLYIDEYNIPDQGSIYVADESK